MLPVADQLYDLQDYILALADDEGVDEVRHWFRVVGAVTAGDYDCLAAASIGNQQRDSAQVQQI